MDRFFIVTGLLFIVLAIPMIRGKLPPNYWYGFRVRKTLDNPEIWFPANAYAGKLLLVYGVAIILITPILPLVLPGLSTDALLWVLTAVLLGGLFIVVLLSWLYLRKM